MYSPGCAIDLSAIAQELPNDYKVSTSLLPNMVAHGHDEILCSNLFVMKPREF